VTRHRLARGGADLTVPLPLPAGASATATRVATTADVGPVWVVADVSSAGGARDVVTYELDRRTGAIGVTRPLGSVDVVTLVALHDELAVIARDRVVTVPDASTGTVATSSVASGAIHDGVAVGDDVWLLDEQARLVRFSTATGRLAPPVPLPSTVRPVGAGARVAGRGTVVWALLPGPPGAPFHAVLASFDTRTDRSSFAIGLPDRIAIAAIAVS
jgi:hypothetical protein